MKTTRAPYTAAAFVPNTQNGMLLQDVYGNTPEEAIQNTREFFKKYPSVLRVNGNTGMWWIPAVVRVSVFPTDTTGPVGYAITAVGIVA
jgi:hypothetical protein